jgi:hypothetical protein
MHNILRSILGLFLLLCSISLSAQNKYTLKGTVQDSTNQALEAASAVLLNASDSVLVSFGLTNNKGAFQLDRIKEGNYVLQITYVGYGTFARAISAEGTESIIDMGIISLNSNINKLAEVTVTADFIPIVIKKDTIEYTADAFKVKPNATVEDLLKKMPGIEVEDDGSIKAQGEDVQSVTVDGKKFFGDDPKVATQNLPADAVKKVQVFDKKSDKAEFTGIDDGDTQKSINLELKEDKKIGVFGNVVGGLGTDERFTSKININKFSDKYQVSTITNFNNLNQQGFNYSDYYALGGRGGRQFINNGSFSPGIARSLTGGLNFSYTFSPKYQLYSSYFVGGVDNTVISTTTSENFINEGSFLQNDFNEGNSENLNHRINFQLEGKPDSLNRFEVESSIQYRTANLNQVESSEILRATNSVSSNVDQLRIGENENVDVDVQMEYGRRLGKKGRSLAVELDLGRVDDFDELILDQENEQFDEANNLIRSTRVIQDQIDEQDNNSYDFRLSYTEPLSKGLFLDLEVRRNNVNSASLKEFFDLDPNNQDIKTLNDALSNSFNNDYTYNYAGASIQKNTDFLKSTFTLDFKNAEINGRVPGNPEIANTFNFILPRIVLNFDQKKLRLQYRTRVNEPSVTQLSPLPDNSNPNSFYLGNPNLQPEYTHTLSARYYFFDSFSFRSLFANLTANYTLNDIVNAIEFDENFRTVLSPVNVDYNQNVNTTLSYSTPIKKLRIKTRLRGSMGLTRGITFLDAIENKVNTTNQTLSATFENLDNERVSVQLSGNWRWNQTSYDQSENRNQDFLTQSYQADLLIDFGKGWTLDNEIRYTIFSEESYGSNNTFTLWNLGLNKSLFKDRLSLKISAFDLLNQNQGINRDNTATSISETISNTLTQYYMLTANYKLSSFGGNNRRMFFMR